MQGPPSSKAVHTPNLTSNRNETIYNDLANRKAFSALCKINLTVYDRHGKYSKHEKGEENVMKKKTGRKGRMILGFSFKLLQNCKVKKLIHNVQVLEHCLLLLSLCFQFVA